jgi:hypothetical protein
MYINLNKEVKKLKEQRLLNLESAEIHERVFEAYKSNTLLIPEVRWHIDSTKIDLSLQRDSFRKELLVDGISVIPEVDIGVLFNKMTKDDALMFRKKKLYNPSFNSKSISIVINHWLQGIKLIPPTIMIFNQEYADTLNIDIIVSKELRPIDGKHRINAAYFFGIKTIPILVRNKQLSIIKTYLNKA